MAPARPEFPAFRRYRRWHRNCVLRETLGEGRAMLLGEQPIQTYGPSGSQLHPPPPGTHPFSLWEGKRFSFDDILDAINPLQQLPVVGTIYRELTGDRMGAAARVVGGLLYGGIAGAASAIANIVFKEATGKDIGETAIAMVFGDHGGSADRPQTPRHKAPVMVASIRDMEYDGTRMTDMIPAARADTDGPSRVMTASAKASEADKIRPPVRKPARTGSPTPASRMAITSPPVKPHTVPKAAPPAAAGPAWLAATPRARPGQRPTMTYALRNGGAMVPAPAATSRATATAGGQGSRVSSARRGASTPATVDGAAALPNGKAADQRAPAESKESMGPWFTTRMLHGLDRYRAVMQDRHGVRRDLDLRT